MKKTLLTERFQQLAGIKPLYTEQSDSKEDQLKMAYAAYDKAEMNGDIRGQELALAVIDSIKDQDTDDYGRSISGKDKRTFVDPKDLTPAARAKKMAQAAYDKAEMNGDIRGMELALAAMDIDKPIPGLNKRLKEIATELGYLNEEVDITYSTPGDRFYKMKVDGKRLDREEGTKYLKNLGIDMEVPRRYRENELDNIVKALEKKGIKADYNDAMDIS